mmetsp:Transcript_36915/g.118330  ORF Transcript_36915/g.118330 Transcript_36915/m.118330 type:complete len:208 (+) Transcript_36915:600-1223(+)
MPRRPRRGHRHRRRVPGLPRSALSHESSVAGEPRQSAPRPRNCPAPHASRRPALRLAVPRPRRHVPRRSRGTTLVRPRPRSQETTRLSLRRRRQGRGRGRGESTRGTKTKKKNDSHGLLRGVGPRQVRQRRRHGTGERRSRRRAARAPPDASRDGARTRGLLLREERRRGLFLFPGRRLRRRAEPGVRRGAEAERVPRSSAAIHRKG